MDSETKNLLGEILALVKSIDERVARLEVQPPSIEEVVGRRHIEKKISIKEYIIDRAPCNAVQMTLAIGYYLEHHEGMSHFNSSDLESGFRAAKESIPSNINDKANMCVKKGYFMEEKEKKDNLKAWILTRSGEEVVKRGFSKNLI